MQPGVDLDREVLSLPQFFEKEKAERLIQTRGKALVVGASRIPKGLLMQVSNVLNSMATETGGTPVHGLVEDLFGSPVRSPSASLIWSTLEPQDVRAQGHAACMRALMGEAEGLGKSYYGKVRGLTGLSAASVAKIRLESEPFDEARWNHYQAVTCMAPVLAGHVGGSLIDVDGKYDTGLPSASDISILSSYEGIDVLWLLDMKTGPASSGDAARLRTQAHVLFGGVACILVTVLVQVKKETFRLPVQLRQGLGRGPVSERNLEAVKAIGRMVILATTKEKRAFLSALDATVGRCAVEGIQRLHLEKSLDDSLGEQARELLFRLESREGGAKARMLKAMQSQGPYAIQIYHEAKSLCAGLPQMAALFDLGGKGMRLETQNVELDFPLALPVADREDKSKLLQALADTDVLFKAVKAAQAMDFCQGLVRGMGVSVSGELVPLVEGEFPNWDKPQSGGTSLPAKFVATLRRPTYVRPTYIHNDLRTSDPGAYFKARHNLDGMSLETLRADYTRAEESVMWPGVQLLVNTSLYPDQGMKKFFGRKAARGVPKDKTSVPQRTPEERDEFAEECEATFEDFVKSCRPSVGYQEYRRRQPLMIANKALGLMHATSPPALAQVAETMAPVGDTLLLDYYDQVGQMCRSFSAYMRERTPANYVILTESAGYAFLSLTFVNSNALTFHSSWAKVLSLGVPALDAHTRLGSVAFPTPPGERSFPRWVSGVLIETEGLGAVSDSPLVARASPFRSYNRNDVDWWMRRAGQAVLRKALLVEARSELYNSREPGIDGTPGAFASDEVTTHLCGYLHSDQQYSVACTAIRYAHQALGSVDVKEGAIFHKLAGLRLKHGSMVVNHFRLARMYALAASLKAALGGGVLRAPNKEVFVALPDLLKASADVHLNVSVYASYAQLNVEKADRAGVEAQCVAGIIGEKRDLEKMTLMYPDLVQGFTEAEMDVIMELDSREPGGVRHPHSAALSGLGGLTALISDGSLDVTVLQRKIQELPNGLPFLSSAWFEIRAHLALRLDVGTMGSVSSLAGRSLQELFTLRGSITVNEPPGLKPVQSMRKATAMFHLIGEMEGLASPRAVREDLLEHAKANSDNYVDAYQLYLAAMAQDVKTAAFIQLSEKDAPGKAREISTLAIAFGVACAYLEKLFIPISSATPEDIILEVNKDKLIMDLVTRVHAKKVAQKEMLTLFINRDMSRHGSTHKSVSSMVTVALLAPDLATLEYGAFVVQTSRGKESIYPHELKAQAFGHVQVLHDGVMAHASMDPKGAAVTYEPTKNLKNTYVDWNSPTSVICHKMREQFFLGNENGARGTCSVNVTEGMPGQGIMSTQASVSHASIIRMMGRDYGTALGWDMTGVANSDDSMIVLTVPAREHEALKLSLRHTMCAYIRAGGLLENEAKFTPTSQRGEMVSFYTLGIEPVAQVMKFGDALCCPNTSASLAEDLLDGVNRGASLVKSGSTAYGGSLLACVQMATAIDAHGSWPVHYPVLAYSLGIAGAERPSVWLTPEEGGLPSSCTTTAALGGLGARLASYAHCDLDEALDDKLVARLVSSLFRAPVRSLPGCGTDIRPVGEDNQGRTAVLYSSSGEVQHKVPVLLQIPGVDGLVGSTRRSKAPSTISKELGAKMSNLHEEMRSVGPSTQLGHLFSAVGRSLRKPVARADLDMSIRCQYADLVHSSTHPSLQLHESSLYRAAGLAPIVSREDLRKFWEVPTAGATMRKALLEQLELPVSVPAWAEGLHAALVSDGVTILRASRQIMAAALRASTKPRGGSEHAPREFVARRLAKRIINVGIPRVRLDDSLDLDSELFALCLSPEALSSATKEVKRALANCICTGTMDADEAQIAGSLMAERVRACLPGPNQVLAVVDTYCMGVDEERDEWVTNGAFLGTSRSWEGGGLRDRPREMSKWSQGMRALDPLVLAEALRAAKASVLRGLAGLKEAPKRVIGHSVAGGQGLGAFMLNGPPSSGGKLKSWILSPLLATVCAHADMACSGTTADLQKLLDLGAKMGPTGTREDRVVTAGPLNVPHSSGPQSLRIYVVTRRTWEAGTLRYAHSVVQVGDLAAGESEILWDPSGAYKKDWYSAVRSAVSVRAGVLEVELALLKRAYRTGGPSSAVVDSYHDVPLIAGDLFRAVQTGWVVMLEQVHAQGRAHAKFPLCYVDEQPLFAQPDHLPRLSMPRKPPGADPYDKVQALLVGKPQLGLEKLLGVLVQGALREVLEHPEKANLARATMGKLLMSCGARGGYLPPSAGASSLAQNWDVLTDEDQTLYEAVVLRQVQRTTDGGAMRGVATSLVDQTDWNLPSPNAVAALLWLAAGGADRAEVSLVSGVPVAALKARGYAAVVSDFKPVSDTVVFKGVPQGSGVSRLQRSAKGLGAVHQALASLEATGMLTPGQDPRFVAALDGMDELPEEERTEMNAETLRVSLSVPSTPIIVAEANQGALDFLRVLQEKRRAREAMRVEGVDPRLEAQETPPVLPLVSPPLLRPPSEEEGTAQGPAFLKGLWNGVPGVQAAPPAKREWGSDEEDEMTDDSY